METQTPKEGTQTEFLPGTSVIYAMHGKCHVLGVEVRSLGEESILFYKLEIKKSSFSRTHKQETAIWVPVANAKDRGLRTPMTREEAESAMKILLSREYYFKIQESWTVLQHQLETTIRQEGGIGLAKAASFLFVLRKKQIVPSSEVIKLQETVHKLLFREMSDALDIPPRILEEKVQKGFRSKLLPDT